jgi:hypothetical protein
MSAAQQLAQSNAAAPPQKSAAAENDDEVPALEGADENGEVDETGLDPKEIELVMAQVNCSRAKAVRVLRENGGDIINASEFLSLFDLAHSLNSYFVSHGCIRLIFSHRLYYTFCNVTTCILSVSIDTMLRASSGAC